TIAAQIIFLDSAGIGNDPGRRERREKFAPVQEGLAKEIPFSPLAVESIYVESDRFSKQTWDPGKWAARHITDENYLGIGEDDVKDRNEAVEQGIEVFARDGGKDNAPNAPIVNVVLTRERLTAIDPHFMPALGQSPGELVGEGFKTAITGGNATCSENGDLHEWCCQMITACGAGSSTRPGGQRRASTRAAPGRAVATSQTWKRPHSGDSASLSQKDLIGVNQNALSIGGGKQLERVFRTIREGKTQEDSGSPGVEAEDGHSGHESLRSISLSNHTGDRKPAASGYELYILHVNSGHGCPVDPAIVEPIQALSSLIT